MKLMLQPGEGPTSIIKAINNAKTSIEIMIFRFDRSEIERALANAVKRGVFVHALVAHSNHAGEDGLRNLEMRLLAAGVNVARTSSDLVRYHGKMMIVDRRELYVLAFNLTYLDIERSRSFGVATTNPKLVHEAVRLFEADAKRLVYEPAQPCLVVSPANARKQLSAFIKGARKELLIYDPTVSDPVMIRLLEERAMAGVEVKIIGRLARRRDVLPSRKLHRLRLHARAIVRDHCDAFIGSQSLREIELDGRREVGIIFRDRRIVHRLVETFREDWEVAGKAQEQKKKNEAAAAERVAKKVAKAVVKELPPATPVLEAAMEEIAHIPIDLSAAEVEETVKDAVKEAVKEALTEVVQDVVEGAGESGPAPSEGGLRRRGHPRMQTEALTPVQ
ncbi:MAG TPA: phospholipase D-like domain-containing protein [Bryobacteraceae bacterium]|nr:phospholipase D-like domain-containing protein [Bryobacteraceae bacterium]